MRDKDFTSRRVNTTELFRRYSEQEIGELLAADLKRRAKIEHGCTTQSVILSTREKAGMTGPETVAEVRVTVDHDPPPTVKAA